MNHNATSLHRTTIASLAAIVAVIGTVSSALAYETGYGPVRLITTQTIDDPVGACKSQDGTPILTRAAAPEYPEIALQEGVEGFSIVTFTMALDGSVSNVKLAGTSGNRLLDQSAVDAVKNSHFAPQIHNCAKIAGIYGVPVVFSLQNASDWPNLVIVGGAGTGSGHTIKQ